MNDFPTNVKEKLNSIISDMAERHWLFSSNPRHDFMRQDLENCLSMIPCV